MSRIKEIKARTLNATPGPWRVEPCSNGGALVKRGSDVPPDRHEQSSIQVMPDADAQFIAHARADIDYLLARVAELEACIKEFIETSEPIVEQGAEAMAWREVASWAERMRTHNDERIQAAAYIVEGVMKEFYAACKAFYAGKLSADAALAAVKNHLAKGEG